MNREIKFRAWDEDKKQMIYPSILGIKNENFAWEHGRDYLHNCQDWGSEDGFIYNPILMQYTGLKDKNDKDIHEQDLLRIKGKMGDKGEYSYDAIYRVREMDYEGLSLSFEKLFSQFPDSVDNSYPITHSPSFKNRCLCTDYRHSNYSHIAFNETSSKNNLSGTSWVEHHYTNDIEIIGNIYENPELLKESK